ncbi:hypothetical protein F4823DRAFT_557913 [Ustulina deusta]|nr:hypothetical protein F4823DRAFT_557913 [Ustulina deusta]
MAPALPWPFCQRPFTIANFDDHRIRLSVAAPVDLNNIAAFCTEYGWAAKQFIAPELLLTPMHMEELMKERYKDAIRAIMDTCTPGTMTGIVIKIEYKDKIRGVMAINVVGPDLDDPWSLNERQVGFRDEMAWIFPSFYMSTLSETLAEEDNHAEPILNIPYFIVALEQPFLSACIPAFKRLVEMIATEYNRTAVLNIESGPYQNCFAPYFTGSTFQHTGELLENVSGIYQSYPTYTIYTHWTNPSVDTPGPYLDRIIRRVFADF